MDVRDVGRTALTVDSCRALVAGSRRGRLVTTVGALPAAEPVPYVADGWQVVVRTVHPARTGEVLCLLVDQVDDSTGAGWSVLVTGTARLIADDDRMVEHLASRAADDWLYGPGRLVVLADPLIRGTARSPAPAPWVRERASEGSATALRLAVSLAVRAPWAHTIQPWRWRTVRDGLDLYVEAGRGLSAIDPDGRERLAGCGASLQHARLALTAAGWGVQTLRFPDPHDPDHLARLRLVGRVPPEERDLHLADAASHRHSDRRPFRSDPVPDDLLTAMTEAARFEDCRLYLVRRDESRRVAALIEDAERARRADAAYRAEVRSRVDDAVSPGTGVLPDTAPDTVAVRAPALRDVGLGALGVPHVEGLAVQPVLAVLCTEGDGRTDWLRAGEAAGRVLLTATAAGLAASSISSPIAVGGIRNTLRDEVLAGAGQPQLLLRLGWPAECPLPPLTSDA